MNNTRKTLIALMIIGISSANPAEARLTRFVIERESTLEKGQMTDSRANPKRLHANAANLGSNSADQYSLIEGHFFGEVDPNDRHNGTINDIKLAPRNERGKVEYSATFKLAMPKNSSKGSNVLIYDVPNRGHGGVVAFEDEHISVISGWQGDIAADQNLQTIDVPAASTDHGHPAAGMVLNRFIDMAQGTSTLSLQKGGFLPSQTPHAVAGSARLYRSESDDGRLELISNADWAFADCHTQPFPGLPDSSKICLRGGFDPHYAYSLSYMAEGPPVLGLGFAATRDLVSFLRYRTTDDAGNSNPVAKRVKWTIVRGVSQSGNFVRSFIQLGFNAGEDGRIIFDGANPIIGVRTVPMDYRFASPGGGGDFYFPGTDGILWWGDFQDKLRHLPKGGLLTRCKEDGSCPKIVEIFGSSEFWGLHASLDLVGSDAKQDIPLPSIVRRYYNPSVTHGGGMGGFATESPVGSPGLSDSCVLPRNPNPTNETNQALLNALIGWIMTGTEPPPSKYPTLANGDLVEPNAKAMGFPIIPGKPRPDGIINPSMQFDFGSKFDAADERGVITNEPPRIVRKLRSVVPRVDADGNELAGIRSYLLQAPLGTYLGWNITSSGYYKGVQCGISGGYIPFAETKAQREANGDFRPSLEERYGSHEGYVAKVRVAVATLVSQRFMLQQAADRIIREAQTSNVLR